MTLEVFLMLLSVVSILTSVTVEGIKRLVGDKYNASSNLVAGITAMILGAIIGVFYCIFVGIAFTAQIVVIIIALVFLSWLCAMIGYDKVVQTIMQIKSKTK